MNPTETAIVWPWFMGPMSWDVVVEAAAPPMTTAPVETIGGFGADPFSMWVDALKMNRVIARIAAIRFESRTSLTRRLFCILNQ